MKIVEPIILSVSRASDIPAFYADWFAEQWQQGHTVWTNPFNRSQKQIVAFNKVRAIVFWTKNPTPIIPFLPVLNQAEISYYFNFTLNNYENLGIELAVPPLEQRLNAFINLAKQIGKNRVRWRFDPLLKWPNANINDLFERISIVGNQLIEHTDRLIFSFVCVQQYRKVQQQLVRSGLYSNKNILDAELTDNEKLNIIAKLSKQAESWRMQNPHFQITSCAEPMDYSSYGIIANKCIDDTLLAEIGKNDPILMQHLGYEKDLWGEVHPSAKIIAKHSGQRKHCNCIFSKDIGSYGTCWHGCIYCYAM